MKVGGERKVDSLSCGVCSETWHAESVECMGKVGENKVTGLLALFSCCTIDVVL